MQQKMCAAFNKIYILFEKIFSLFNINVNSSILQKDIKQTDVLKKNSTPIVTSLHPTQHPTFNYHDGRNRKKNQQSESCLEE